MHRISLAGQWKRSIGGTVIDTIAVPGSYAPIGECMLERSFDFPVDRMQPTHRIFLCTDGVLASADFSLNGTVIGTAGPWTPYRFEVPRGLLKSANAMTARIRDMTERFGLTPGRRMDAGLIRDIRLEIRPAAFIDSFLFTYDLSADFSKAACSVDAALDGETHGTTVTATLADARTGRQVAEASAPAGRCIRFDVAAAEPWSPASPRLYTLRVSARGGVADGEEVIEEVGFRRIEVRGQDFFLNGNRLILKGVCRHEFMADHPFSPPEKVVERDLALIRHAGFNFIRLVHSPQSSAICRIAARLGLLVSEEPGACFMDLADEEIASRAVESMRRTVMRDRNCPSVLAWLIYNECLPHAAYAKKITEVIRAVDPTGRPIGMADCSGRVDDVKEMARAGGLSFYGINVYSFDLDAYVKVMETYTDLPLVFTEWGACLSIGNPRVTGGYHDLFTTHTREGALPRMAGFSFWVWQDYPECTRRGWSTIDGWTMEGPVDRTGKVKPDLLNLSMLCFDIDHPSVPREILPRILFQSPERQERWTPVDLEGVMGDQSGLEAEIGQMRAAYGGGVPTLHPLIVDGMLFTPRHGGSPSSPLLIGLGRDELVIPVGRMTDAVAILGHVDFRGGYPGSDLYSVHTGSTLRARAYGQPASAYIFEFEDGTEEEELRHGVDVLRSNAICRWWNVDPHGPRTRAALEAVIHPSYEILCIQLWEKRFDRPRLLRRIRWRSRDPEAIQALFALSVRAQ